MNIFNIGNELKFANRIGQTLSTEERISLEVSVLKLSQEYHFEVFNFWGRIEGVSKNYYIVQAVSFKGATSFPIKKYFWRYLSNHIALRISSSPNCHRRATNTQSKWAEWTIICQDSTRKCFSRATASTAKF
jgi:hypothetical protein